MVALQMHFSLVLAEVANVELDSSHPLAENPDRDSTISPPANAMTWPMLPGESVATLAVLFYPHDTGLQKRFVRKTLQLSQSIQPRLTAESIAVQPNLIIIPELKSLGAAGRIRPARQPHSPSTAPLQMSYGLKDAAEFIVPAKLLQQYQALLVHNESLKLQLAKLNAHLAQLEQTMAALSQQAKRLWAAATHPAAENSSSSNTNKPLNVKADSTTATIQMMQPVASIPVIRADKGPLSNFNALLWLIILLVAAVLLGLVRLYARRKSRALYLASINTFEPIVIAPELQRDPGVQAINAVDFSLTHDGLSESMSVTDLSQYDVLEEGADGELVLEQAKIYAHIGRSDEAIALLRSHIENQPKASLHHWLYLLDMYRDTGQQEAFAQYATLLHQHFNVMTPLWGADAAPVSFATSIEAFPHIMQQLTILWSDPQKNVETQAYLDYLLTDNRDSVRAGFSMEVFQELILLSDIMALRDRFAVVVNAETL